MNILVSYSEPEEYKKLGRSSTFPECKGVDFLWTAHKQLVGVQRKKFPSDLLASLHDGRLGKEIQQMQELDQRVLIIEGQPKWDKRGNLKNYPGKYTKKQFIGLLYSLNLRYGIPTILVEGYNEVLEAITCLYDYTNKRDGGVLVARPKGNWTKPTSKAKRLWFLQGIDGVGPRISESIVERFGGLPLSLTCTEQELNNVKGIPKKVVQEIIQLIGGQHGA